MPIRCVGDFQPYISDEQPPVPVRRGSVIAETPHAFVVCAPPVTILVSEFQTQVIHAYRPDEEPHG